MTKSFCEIMVLEIMPAVRALIAKELVEAHGWKQVDVARMMDMTQPAISQYMKNIRGGNAKFAEDTSVIGSIKSLADKINGSDMQKNEIDSEIIGICRIIGRKMMPEGECRICVLKNEQ